MEKEYLRRATPEDLPLLLGMMKAFYVDQQIPYDESAAERSLSSVLRDPTRGWIWLLLYEGRVAGYVVVALYFSLEFRGMTAIVDELFVASDYRARGLGSETLRSIEHEARQRGVTTLRLEVGHENPGARRLYERFDFEVEERTLMTKRL